MKNLKIYSGLAMLALIGIFAQFVVFNQFMAEMHNITFIPETIAKTQPDAKFDPLDDEVCSMNDVKCPGEGKGESEAMIRTITAYNVGDPSQTDASPCTGATGENLCEALARGEKIVATNELPLGSKVKINGEVYTVKDRTNSRYTYRYDIAFPFDQHQEALRWGVKNLEITKITN